MSDFFKISPVDETIDDKIQRLKTELRDLLVYENHDNDIIGKCLRLTKSYRGEDHDYWFKKFVNIHDTYVGGGLNTIKVLGQLTFPNADARKRYCVNILEEGIKSCRNLEIFEDFYNLMTISIVSRGGSVG